MTPKEKAKELLLKYDSLTTWISENKTLLQTQKQCALIAVNEIIKALRKDLPEIGLGKGYWYIVKKEIKNL